MTKRLITLFTGTALALALALSAAAEMTQPSEPVTDMMIGSMLMFSFDGTELTADDPFLDLVRKGHVGGVTLFNRKPDGSDMNVASPAQLKRLTRTLTEAAPGPFLIAVDQEGGRVRRLWPGKGFFDLPSAREMSLGSPAQTRETAEKLGRELRKLGIHVDFAPVVDVNVNPDCPIIGALGRSFGTDERTVSAHAQAFGAGLTAQGVIPALKHFPGHGSSRTDSHLGTTDITHTWQKRELFPYVDAIASGWPGMIMSASLFHARLDPALPGSLSSRVTTDLLRGLLGFDGVIVTDSLLMGAVTDHYTIEQTVELAVNAGADILLFVSSDVYGPELAERTFKALRALVDSGRISHERIRVSWRRITAMYRRYAAFAPELYPWKDEI